MKPFYFVVLGLAGCCLTSCDSAKSESSSAGSQVETNAGPVNAKPDPHSGPPALTEEGILVLPEESRKAMAITIGPVQQKTFAGAQNLSFQIFREADEKPLPGQMYRPGFAYAMTLLGSKAAVPKQGQGALISSSDLKNLTAHVVAIDALPGSAAHQSEVVVEIPDKEHRFELSQSCTASFPAEATTTALVIPPSALLTITPGTFAYVSVPNGFKRTPVTVGAATAYEIQILEGLKPGDEIVTNPVQILWLTELKLKSGDGA